jgi:hypothetical protein
MKETTTQVFQDAITSGDDVLITAIAQVQQRHPQGRDFTAKFHAIYPGDRSGRWHDIRVTFLP